MTMNSTGRKNMIIGTVNLAGRAAAFFSAAAMRASRFSWASTRSATDTGVPYRSDCSNAVQSDLMDGKPVRSARFS